MQISTTTMESSMEIPHKAKDRTAMWFSDTTPAIYPKEHKSGSNGYLYTDVHRSTVHKNQALETTQVLHNRW
jgi:hypothetical protein